MKALILIASLLVGCSDAPEAVAECPDGKYTEYTIKYFKGVHSHGTIEVTCGGGQVITKSI